MKRTCLALAAVSLLILQTPAQAAREPHAGETAAINAAFASWRTALSSGNHEKIVNLYDKDAVLLATLAAKPLTTQAERLSYFSKLVAKPKLSATVDAEYIKVFDEDTALASGLYTFRFEENGKTVAIPARYSFVYEKENGQWLIAEHHSSKVPE